MYTASRRKIVRMSSIDVGFLSPSSSGERRIRPTSSSTVFLASFARRSESPWIVKHGAVRVGCVGFAHATAFVKAIAKRPNVQRLIVSIARHHTNVVRRGQCLF